MRLTEGRKEFLAWAGGDKELLSKFLASRSKFQSPENNMDYWVSKKTPQDLKDFIDSYKSKTAKEKEDRIEGADKIYEDENWQVIHIKTYKAAKQYGRGSKWCICGNYPGHESRGEEYFNDYLRSKYSGYYLFIDKHPSDPAIDGKYMVCPKQDGSGADVWDQADDNIEIIQGKDVPYIKGLPYVGVWSIDDNGKLVQYKGYRVKENVVIPDTVTMIGKQVFYKKDIGSVTIPDTVKMIGSGAFAGCDYLERIILPDSVEKIGIGVVMACSRLKEVTIGSGITTLTKNLCAYNDELKRVAVRGVIQEIDDTWLDDSYNEDLAIYSLEKNTKLIEWCKARNITVANLNTMEVF